MSPIAITGSTGTVGKEVMKVLREKGVSTKPLSRTFAPPFDYTLPDTYAAALDGIERLLLIAPQGSPAITSFLKQGSQLKQVVVISGISANSRFSQLGALEQCVLDAKVPFTFLRCNWFLQNFTGFLKEDLLKGVLELPFGDGKVSFVDVRDIAECVAAVFTNDHLGKIYTLTGPESFTFTEAARLLYPRVNTLFLDEAAAREKFRGWGWSEEGIDEMLLLFQEICQGVVAPVSSDVSQLLGKKARTLKQFAHDFFS